MDAQGGGMTSSRIRGILLLLGAAAAGMRAEADVPSGIGPSLSWNRGVVFGADASILPVARPLPIWTSVGTFLRTDRLACGAYLEAGAWVLLNLGAGASWGLGSQEGARAHAFAGFPLPIHGITSPKRPGLYLEPFYRPSLPIGGAGALRHEFGILLKYTPVQIGSWNRASAEGRDSRP